MSSVHTVKCECGFLSSVSAGGTRENFQNECYFPHYCKKCGIVDVNTAKHEILCPKCNSSDVQAYGTKELSNYKEKEIIPAIQSFNYFAYRFNNYCPACKQLTLEIEPPSILFD